MPRFFNTTGPCEPEYHYTLSPTARLPTIEGLVERRQYFVIHAPRQTGKTTAMRALVETLRAKGLAACWATLESARGVDDVASAEPLWLRALHRGSRGLPEAWRGPDPALFTMKPAGSRLGDYLAS